jgi:membrane protein implicated in regulation of membrane protease activity
LNPILTWLRRFADLERLPQSELHHRGMLVLGFGICCFAALLTLQLFDANLRWLGLTFAVMAVASVTLAAVLFEAASRST